MKELLKYSIVIVLIFNLYCSGKEPVKIGFAGSLSGKFSDFGTDGRDGVISAIEKINSEGGINGRKLELLTSDDKGSAEAARKGDIDLINRGAAVIIGHMTSSMTMAVADIVNENKVVMVSPTVSTDLLNDIDDYIIRVVSSTKVESLTLAEKVYDLYKIRSISFIYDLSNRDYTESWVKNFKAAFSKKGGRSIETISFSSLDTMQYSKIAEDALRKGPDAVAVVANSQDTALICQQIRKKTRLPIFACAWSQTKDLIIQGGGSVEGVILSHQFSKDNVSEDYPEFKKSFTRRFNREPEFPAVFSYNAMMVIADALKRDDNISNLKKTILEKREYKGIHSNFKINEYGDAITEFHLISIKEGKFVGIPNKEEAVK